MLVKRFIGRAGAKARHAHESSVGANDLIPALAHAGLDRDLHRRVADHRLARGGVLLLEMLTFVLVLGVGYIYIWKRGALQWD